MASRYKKNILFEHFNTNALCSEPYVGVENVVTDYVLMVTEPTRLDGGLLDLLYLWKQFLMGKHANSKVYFGS